MRNHIINNFCNINFRMSTSYSLAEIKSKLSGIFEFYASPGVSSSTKKVKNAKFKKLALDAGIVNSNEHCPEIDIIFAKTASQQSSGLTRTEFFDALLKVAEFKFPGQSVRKALDSLFEQYLSAFADPTVSDQIAPEADFGIWVSSNSERLRGMYMHYFPNEVNPHFLPPAASQQIVSMKGFASLLGHLGVVPDFLSRAAAFAIYRDVMADQSITGGLGGMGGLGRVVTFSRCMHAILRAARQLAVVLWTSEGVLSDGVKCDRLIARMTGISNFQVAEQHQSPPIETARVPGLVVRLFEYYCELGDPLNRKFLSSAKWLRFLKEGGVWGGSEESLATGGFIGKTEADMLFVEITGGKPHMELSQFFKILQVLASRLLPALIAKGFAEGVVTDGWEVLTKCMLEPLADAVLGNIRKGLSTSDAAHAIVEETIMRVSSPEQRSDPKLDDLIVRTRSSTLRLFKHFCDPRNSAKMNREGFLRLTQMFGLSGNEVAPLTVHKIFSVISRGGKEDGIGIMGFEKGLMILSDKCFPGDSMGSYEKLLVLFHRLNAACSKAGLLVAPGLLYQVEVPDFFTDSKKADSGWKQLVKLERLPRNTNSNEK